MTDQSVIIEGNPLPDQVNKATNKNLGKREAILMAAIAVFAEHGYQGATMDQIARRAGVAKGTAYLHFADKADLFYAVFERWAGEVVSDSVQAMATAQTASDKLLALALGAVGFMNEHREWFPLSLEVWSASGSPALRDRFAVALSDLYARYRTETAAIIRAGQSAGEFRETADADALAAFLVGALDGVLLQCWFDPSLDAAAMFRGFFDSLLHGLQVPSASADG